MTKRVATHERVTREDDVKGSSNRTFGFVFAVVFAVIGVWPLIHGDQVRMWALAIALLFLAAAILRPALLRPLNRLWMKFGVLLQQVVNPLVMAVLFYLFITPMGLAMRLFRKDLLRLRFEPEARSYWIERQPPGPAPETMTQQF